MTKITSTAETLIRWFVFVMLSITVVFVIIALFSKDTRGEANTGSFESQTFNDGWTLEKDGKTEKISLPTYVDIEKGGTLILKNTLPDDLTDGSSMMMRSSIEDMYVYINGKLREQYASDSISTRQYYLPSAYSE